MARKTTQRGSDRVSAPLREDGSRPAALSSLEDQRRPADFGRHSSGSLREIFGQPGPARVGSGAGRTILSAANREKLFDRQSSSGAASDAAPHSDRRSV